MKDFQPSKSRDSMSFVENQIYRTLQSLPDFYTIQHGDINLRLAELPSGERFSYKPDFEIRDNNGRTLFVELKSERAMSLPNMIRFAAIDKMIRSRPGMAFLILVWGNDASTSRLSSRDEFKSLHIRHINSDSEVIECINSAFKSLSNEKL